jgi:hypothetical protein
MAKKKVVFVLVEECESGYYEDLSSHLILGVYSTEKKADAAYSEWRAEHEFEGESDWCSCHGHGASIDEVLMDDGL